MAEPDYPALLRKAGARYRRADAARRAADEERAHLAKAAHDEGKMPMRTIAEHLDDHLTIVARLLRR